MFRTCTISNILDVTPKKQTSKSMLDEKYRQWKWESLMILTAHLLGSYLPSLLKGCWFILLISVVSLSEVSDCRSPPRSTLALRLLGPEPVSPVIERQGEGSQLNNMHAPLSFLESNTNIYFPHLYCHRYWFAIRCPHSSPNTESFKLCLTNHCLKNIYFLKRRSIIELRQTLSASESEVWSLNFENYRNIVENLNNFWMNWKLQNFNSGNTRFLE